MLNWNDISLYKFQQIEAINALKIPDIDKTLFITALCFDLTEYQLDDMQLGKVQGMIAQVNRVFESTLSPAPRHRIGRYRLSYDPDKFTFGQYIELAFFMQNGIANAHYVLASISRRIWGKYDSGSHRKRADFFHAVPVADAIGSIALLSERWVSFNKEYAGLFGLDREVAGPEAPEDKFNKRYGWIYSASQVAEYERITVEQSFMLPVRQALNDLAYLKAKGKYESELLKK